MNELEVINYLKENKTKGVTLAFMPKEVKEYCKDNMFQADIPFRELTRGGWQKLAYDASFCDEIAYCLESYYEPKSSFKPHWEEFSIDENGYFYYEDVAFHYRDDALFEKRSSGIFKGFGGWLYADGKWRTSPTLYHEICDNACYTGTCGDNCEPAVPTKIRFWRRKER